MANKSIFKSYTGKLIPKADMINEAGGPAYQLSTRHALAQIAVTGSTNSTFYASAEEQVKQVLALCEQVDAKFIGQTAIYARTKGYMKDMPALLCAIIAAKDSATFKAVFNQVVDNGKMLRNVVQIIRSGVTGRKSLGSVPKKAVQNWLAALSDEQLFKASVGQDPSLADVIKMVHPKPDTASRAAIYAYLIGRKYDGDSLPILVKQFEAFKNKESTVIPDLPFQMLTSLNLGKAEWSEIARNAKWQMTRMNLNTFARHGVFEDLELVRIIANRLKNEEAILKARAFPYQLMAAAQNVNAGTPPQIKNALVEAMEISLKNVPTIEGQVYICADVSGSMGSPVTGFRPGATSSVRCIDVAALVACAIARKNRSARILPFENNVVEVKLNHSRPVLENAAKLASIGGGGTNCSAPMQLLNAENAKGDLVLYVSDNQSWMDAGVAQGGTELMKQWAIYKGRNPKAKLVCLDIQPYAHTQAREQDDILNIGGFSDQVFEVISEFANGTLNADHWVGEIQKVTF